MWCYNASLTSFRQILNKHTIVDMFYSKWTSHLISHLRLCLRLEIALRNPFSQDKSMIVYISVMSIGSPNFIQRALPFIPWSFPSSSVYVKFSRLLRSYKCSLALVTTLSDPFLIKYDNSNKDCKKNKRL